MKADAGACGRGRSEAGEHSAAEAPRRTAEHCDEAEREYHLPTVAESLSVVAMSGEAAEDEEAWRPICA
jgi:hypothetical protein